MKHVLITIAAVALSLIIPSTVSASTIGTDSMGKGTVTADNLYVGGTAYFSGSIKPFLCNSEEGTNSINEILVTSRNADTGGEPQGDLSHAVAQIYVNGALVQGTETRSWAGNINITPTNIKETKNSDKITFTVNNIKIRSGGKAVFGVAIEQTNTNMCQSVDGYFTIMQTPPIVVTPTPTPAPTSTPTPTPTLSPVPPSPTPALSTGQTNVFSMVGQSVSNFFHWIRSLFGVKN